MNDRIKELWTKAGGHYDAGNQHTYPQYTIDNPEKFAELIITEVTDILATYRTKLIFDDGIEYNCVHPIQAIQKHFGVE